MVFLDLYQPATRRLFHGAPGKKSPYGHHFGGEADYAGLRAFKRKAPVHLLFRLNTEDPALGIKLPDAQWLPLLCAVRYAACDLGYRVLSDSKVRILHQSERSPWRKFPYTPYPDNFPSQKVSFKEGSYDPDNRDDVIRYTGIFGYEAVSKKMWNRLLRWVEKQNLPELFGWRTPEAFLEEGTAWPYWQGRPEEDCPDPACVHHGCPSSLQTFAIFQGDNKTNRLIWGSHGMDLQIIYQICPKCTAIRTTNQCT